MKTEKIINLPIKNQASLAEMCSRNLLSCAAEAHGEPLEDILRRISFLEIDDLKQLKAIFENVLRFDDAPRSQGQHF